jgi:cysteine desulfurase/selenocysteine lyase
MSTADRAAPLGVPGGWPAGREGPESTPDLSREIERLAKQFFGGPSAPGGIDVPAPPVPSDAPPLASPPHFGPSALAVGTGGFSPALAAPPVPGPIKQPPLAVAPPPKESDLRALPTLVSDQLGWPMGARVETPPELPQGAGGVPYFLEIAGLPRSAPTQAPAHGATGSSLDGHAPPDGSRAALPDATPEPTLPGSHDFRPTLVPAVDLASAGPAGGIFDAHVVRRDFPILQERIRGRRLVWLDNAATTQKPRSVIDRISTYYERENSNVHRAAHTLAARATDAYEGARVTVQRFLNAPSAQEIVFVRGATEAINLVAKSWGGANVGAGDEIVITWLEHHANIVPWQQLASDKGAILRVAPVDSRGQVKLDEYERLFGPRTRIAAFTHVSNALGTVTPVREMIEIAHRRGALALVDGAQSVSHMRVDVQALDCDFYCFSGHKVFAPTGIGVLWGKKSILDRMPPWQGGGNMISDVTFEKTTYQAAPARFEAGTNSIGDAAGLGAALDYLTGLGIENVARHEHELLVYGQEQLLRVPGLQIIGTAPDKAGVLSFVIDGVKTEEVSAALDQEGIAVRSGHHCAQPILRRFGLESTVRASLAPYNTKEDIDALVDAVARLRPGARLAAV